MISLCRASLSTMAKSWWKMASVAMVRVAIFKVKAMLFLWNSCVKWMGRFLVLM